MNSLTELFCLIDDFCQRFEPEWEKHLLAAGRKKRQLEFHYTPKHGSWLDIAEIEFAVLSNMCLKQRNADEDSLKRIFAANVAERNAKTQLVRWKFIAKDARVKLQRLYPVIST